MQSIDELVKLGRFDEAYAALTHHIAQQSEQANNTDIQCQLGMLSYAAGHYREAERHLKAALSASPQNFDAHYYLGLTFLKQNRPADAMPEFRATCELKEDSFIAHLHWGIALFQMGSYRGALGQFNKAIAIDPRIPIAYYQSGAASFQLGLLPESAKFFEQACKIDPQFSPAYNGLGIVLFGLQDYGEAEHAFAKAWQLNSTVPTVWRNWASALNKLGRIDEAKKLYQDAMNLPTMVLEARERALIYNDWAVSLYQQNQLEEAAEKFLRAYETDPGLIDAAINLGLVRMVLEEYDGAAHIFEKVLKDSPNTVSALRYGACAYLFVGHYEEALSKLRSLESQGYLTAQVDLWMGYCLLARNDVPAALKSFQRIIENEPNNYLALDALGSALELAGNHKQAADMFLQSTKLNPKYALAHLHLARSYERADQAELAKQEYKAAVTCDPNCLLVEKEGVEEFFNNQNFEAAIKQSLKILSIDPGDLDAKLALARGYKAQNKLAEAIQLLERTLAERPDSVKARVIIGQIYLDQGRYAEADEMFRLAAMQSDSDPQLYYSWAKTLSSLGLYELALEKHENASALDPYDADNYQAWAAILKMLGRYTEASDVFKKASQYF
jgi:tetratricopeptide (TPR) repeat protein